MIEEEVEVDPYEFTQVLPSAEAFQTAERVMEQLIRAEQRARQSSGCARADGFEGNRLFGAPKKAKIMPRRQALNKEASNEPVAGAASSNGGGSSSTGGVAMDIEHLPITMQYRELRRRPFDERMLVRKSSIHGYGLFLKEAVSEGQMIVEYQGQMINQTVADERERRYEEQGVGSCYMFRLDEKTIIDATRCGNLARFINHSCDPKAFARIVTVEGGEKKIVIFAKRAIAVGDEFREGGAASVARARRHGQVLQTFCSKEQGILMEAYSPLARAQKMHDRTLKQVASEAGATSAQVLIAWSLANGENIDRRS
ncbi:hypothetical protein PR003_g7531 [Phytophthora rubi]|nr:hypothetical protein PR003_g7531 [Phytophthora rubi]